MRGGDSEAATSRAEIHRIATIWQDQHLSREAQVQPEPEGTFKAVPIECRKCAGCDTPKRRRSLSGERSSIGAWGQPWCGYAVCESRLSWRLGHSVVSLGRPPASPVQQRKL
jgi:hypothetical protein